MRRTPSKTSRALALARIGLRLLPMRIPGKARLGRLVVRHLAPDGPVVLPASGLVFRVPSLREPVAVNLFMHGIYEKTTQRALLDALPEHGTLVDAGANIGSICLPIARERPDVTVVAIEGDPDIAAVLSENVARNRLTNVHIVNALVGERSAKIPFYPAPRSQFGMGSVWERFDTSPILLEQRTIEDILFHLDMDKVDVLKLDIEGAEFKALRGAERFLRRGVRRVVFEVAPWAERRIDGQEGGESQRLLLELGYHLSFLTKPDEYLAEPTGVGGMLIAVPDLDRMRGADAHS